MKTRMRETSLRAYYDIVLPTLSKRQQQVIDIFFKFPDFNFSNRELAEELSWDVNRVTPRTFELREQGVLTESRKRFCKITGQRVWAWKIA